jgi:hypothetical protein
MNHHRHPVQFCFLIAGFICIAIFSGCRGPAAMRSVSLDYSRAYAETSNQQMLLNLARRSNAHPIYFLQMGLINSTFQFGVNGGGNIGQNRTRASGGALAAAAALSDTIATGGNLGVTVAEQPTFSFTPLSGSSFAAALFNPIDPRVFFNLFNQGYPVDILMRVMVQSISITDGEGTRTFFNILDIERTDNYRNFLTVAALSRELQKKHLLSSSPDASGFVLADGAQQTIIKLRENPAFQFETDGTSFQPAKTNQTQGAVSFNLRTFEGVLSALATEGQLFDYIVAKDGARFTERTPPSELRPILRIRPDKSPGKSTRPVVEVTYLGEKYVIADKEIDDANTRWVESSTWNRDVFNLLNQLYVQISLDPNKLPVQQLIQIR